MNSISSMLQVLGFSSLGFALTTQRLPAVHTTTRRANQGARRMVGSHFTMQNRGTVAAIASSIAERTRATCPLPQPQPADISDGCAAPSVAP